MPTEIVGIAAIYKFYETDNFQNPLVALILVTLPDFFLHISSENGNKGRFLRTVPEVRMKLDKML